MTNESDQRSFKLEHIEVGAGLDEFAHEDELAETRLPTTFKIDDVTGELPSLVEDVDWQEEGAPLASPVAAPPSMAHQRARGMLALPGATARRVATSSASAGRRVIRVVALGVSNVATEGSRLAMAARDQTYVLALAIALIAYQRARGIVRLPGAAARQVATSSTSVGRRAIRVVAVGVSGVATNGSRVAAALSGAWRAIETAQRRGDAAVRSLGRLRFHRPAVLRESRTAFGALAVASFVGLLVMGWDQPSSTPVPTVSPAAVAQDTRTPADVLAAGVTTLPPTIGLPAPLATSAPAPRRNSPARLTSVPSVAPPEPQTVYRGTVGVQPQPVNRPPVVLASVDATPPAAAAPVAEAVVPAAIRPTEVPSAAMADAAIVTRPAIAVDSMLADHSAIEDVLASYRRSYNTLDAHAMSAIWHGVDTRALARGFSGLARQNVLFQRCNVRVTGADRATAQCDGILSYVQKAGDTSPHQRRVSWSIDFSRPAENWVIVGVLAR